MMADVLMKDARYERGAMILTSNRGFPEWGEVFGDPVVATARIASSTMPSSFRSRAQATASANTPISCRSTFAPKPSSMRQSQHRLRAVAVGLPKTELMITLPADHRNRRPGEFYFGTSEEN